MQAERWVGVVALGLALSGCASPPNTPGAGVGRNYTPVIDMRGVDGARYHDDLSSCRQSASMLDADRQEFMGVLGGALIGAAIGASYSSNPRVINAGANSGAISGGAAAGGRARSRQEFIMGNCMASRGCRVLDGTAQISFAAGQVVPTGITAPVPVAQPAETSAPAPHPEARQVTLMPAAQPAPITIISARSVELGAPTVTVKPSGADAFSAEKLSRDLKCGTEKQANLVGKGPGYESYSFACGNGETLIVRCEYGACRALK